MYPHLTLLTTCCVCPLLLLRSLSSLLPLPPSPPAGLGAQKPGGFGAAGLFGQSPSLGGGGAASGLFGQSTPQLRTSTALGGGLGVGGVVTAGMFGNAGTGELPPFLPSPLSLSLSPSPSLPLSLFFLFSLIITKQLPITLCISPTHYPMPRPMPRPSRPWSGCWPRHPCTLWYHCQIRGKCLPAC